MSALDQVGLADFFEVHGKADSGEAAPTLWDTDRDGLCDGNCSGKGEDFNLNGTRDQDADGNWTETDFLANDSDVDGVLDGAEVNGTYCFKEGSCSNEAHPLDPLNADTDGDGLRDGQELAGWTVGVHREGTVEGGKNLTWNVTSEPWVGSTDFDADGLTDFNEFMNGSDPRNNDTDGDRILDWTEIQFGTNGTSGITTIEGTPPNITNFTYTREEEGNIFGILYGAYHLYIRIQFDVADNVGIERINVSFAYGTSAPVLSPTVQPGAVNCTLLLCRVSQRFEVSFVEAVLLPGSVNVSVWDVNGNGASQVFGVKSLLQEAIEFVIGQLVKFANAVAEAASFAVTWVLGAIKSLMEPLIKPVFDALSNAIRLMIEGVIETIDRLFAGDVIGALIAAGKIVKGLLGDLFTIVFGVILVVQIGLLLLLAITGGLAAIVQPLLQSIISTVVGFLLSAAISAVGVLDSLIGATESMNADVFEGLLASGGNSARGDMGNFSLLVDIGLIGFAIAGFLVARKANGDFLKASKPANDEYKQWTAIWQGFRADSSIAEGPQRAMRHVLSDYIFEHLLPPQLERDAKQKNFMDYFVAQAGCIAAALSALFFSALDTHFHIANNTAQRLYLRGVALFYGVWALKLEMRADALAEKLNVVVLTKTIDKIALAISIGSLAYSAYEFFKVLNEFKEAQWGSAS